MTSPDTGRVVISELSPPWFLGVDPGAHGGIAILNRIGSALAFQPLPQGPEALAAALRPWTVAGPRGLLACVEAVGPRPGEGVVSVATFARGYGAILGVLAAFSVPVVAPHPLTWQAAILGREKGRAGDRKASKAASVAWCRRRWPGVNLVQPGSRVPHDGVADALCLAEFCRRQWRDV